MKPKDYLPLAIVVLVFSFYVLTIRGGHPWGDDFAMYIHEAKNLAEHTPLSQTGYIYNPQRPMVGPKLYPPVFPALLVPAYWIGRPDNLRPMKLEMTVFLVATLFVLWKGLGRDLSPFQRAAMLAIIGFNPLFWDYKDYVMSDVPFTFLLYLTLATAEKVRTDSASASDRGNLLKSGGLWSLLGLAALIYLCYGTRTIAITVIATLALIGVLYWKRGGRRLLAAASLGLVLCMAQAKFLGTDASYLDQLKLPLPALVHDVLANIREYWWTLAIFWDNPYSRACRLIILVIVSALALLGYLHRLRNAPRSYELFFPLYLATVLLWPTPDGFRYLMPILPLYVSYFLEGAEMVVASMRVKRRSMILAPLLALIFVSYVAEYTRADFGPFREGITKKETVELFSFVKANTRATDIFIFAKPRALSLYTDRAASIYPSLQRRSEVCRYAQMIGATYLISAPKVDDPKFDDFLAMEPLPKQLIFSNSDFRVFRVAPVDLEQCSREKTTASAHAD